MEQITKIEQIQQVVDSGARVLVVVTKENCPNCTVTKANIETLANEDKGLVVFEVNAVQEDSAINRALLPKSRFVFPVIHSFYQGVHYRGTTGARTTEQLRESFVTVEQMKLAYYDLCEHNRRIEAKIKQEIDGNVPFTRQEVAPPLQDPMEDTQCDSCQ